MTVPNTVSAQIVYFEPPEDGSKPYFYINKTAEGKDHNYKNVPYTVEIENLRGKEDTASLDTTGFQFFRRTAKHTSLANDEEIAREYYPESIALVKELTGASRVVLFDHSTSHTPSGQPRHLGRHANAPIH